MLNMFIALVVMILSFQCFTITYRLNGINRILFEIPLSIFEVSIPLVQEEDDITIYFAKEELIKELNYYFDTKLPLYTDQYQIDYYFTKTGDSSMCLDNHCTAIEISLSANIVFFSQYQNMARYEIREGHYGY